MGANRNLGRNICLEAFDEAATVALASVAVEDGANSNIRTSDNAKIPIIKIILFLILTSYVDLIF
jgi:hypothetical protein